MLLLIKAATDHKAVKVPIIYKKLMSLSLYRDISNEHYLVPWESVIIYADIFNKPVVTVITWQILISVIFMLAVSGCWDILSILHDKLQRIEFYYYPLQKWAVRNSIVTSAKILRRKNWW